MSAGRPNRWTGQIAFVRGVMAAAIAVRVDVVGVGLDVDEHRRGAGVQDRADTVALNVWPTVMTSSPGPSPSPAKMHISATVPLLTAIAWRDADERGPALLELRDPPAAGQHPAAQDLGDRRDLRVVDVRAGDRDHAGPGLDGACRRPGRTV